MALIPLATQGNYLHIYDFKVDADKIDEFVKLFNEFDYSPGNPMHKSPAQVKDGVLYGRGAVDIRVLPLSPLELEQFTAHVDTRTSTALSRLTSPTPLYVQDSRRVLVVDDNVVNQIVARGQLEALGYQVVVAADGIEALDSCCNEPPDMVLMDVDMPVMDGLEASEHLRSLQRIGTLPPFPIVAATASDSDTARLTRNTSACRRLSVALLCVTRT